MEYVPQIDRSSEEIDQFDVGYSQQCLSSTSADDSVEPNKSTDYSSIESGMDRFDGFYGDDQID